MTKRACCRGVLISIKVHRSAWLLGGMAFILFAKNFINDLEPGPLNVLRYVTDRRPSLKWRSCCAGVEQSYIPMYNVLYYFNQCGDTIIVNKNRLSRRKPHAMANKI